MYKYLAVVILVVVAYVAGKYSTPAKVETKIVEKVVVKEVEKVQKDQIYETLEITRPDKTVIKTTKLVDKSLILREETREQSRSEKKVILNRPNKILGLGYNNTVWSAEYNQRVLELPVFIGVQGIRDNERSENRVLFKVLMEF